MLHLLRRHRTTCPHTSTTYRRCQCPIHVKGTLGGVFIRRGLDLTSWEAAQALVGKWTAAGKIGELVDVSQTIEDAIAAFLADLQVRELSAVTIAKYRVLLVSRLTAWANEQGYTFLQALDLDGLSKFRATWPDAPLAKSKNSERLKAFFSWCQARGWLPANPAHGLTSVKVPHAPTLPYTTDEMSSILAAVDSYPTFNQYGYDNRARVRAFVLTLRWTGLRIRDVVTLTWDQVKDGKVRLYTQKTGQHVHVPLPQVCIDALNSIKPAANDAVNSIKAYVFWTGNGNPKSAVADWQRTLRRLFAIAKIDGAHAHRFRDTFAVELLLAGVDMTDVSVLLGHASIRVTEKHYAAWVATRQRRLESIVQRTWQTDGSPSAPAARPDGVPALRPTAESASTVPTSPRPARTGTDDVPTPARRPTLRLVPSQRNEAR